MTRRDTHVLSHVSWRCVKCAKHNPFRKAVAFVFRKLELCRHFRFQASLSRDFRLGFGVWHIRHVDHHAHFTLKFRLSLVNETHIKHR